MLRGLRSRTPRVYRFKAKIRPIGFSSLQGLGFRCLRLFYRFKGLNGV